MPIAFPLPKRSDNVGAFTGYPQLYQNPFAVLPPNLARPGARTTDDILNNGGPLPRRPGASGGGATANVRRFGTVYANVQNTSVINPAGGSIPSQQVLNDRRVYDRVQGYKTGLISGISRDKDGAALGNCRVMIFRTALDPAVQAFVGETTSDGSGNWSYTIMESGAFFLVEYLTGSPDRAGTSVNTIVPTYTDV